MAKDTEQRRAEAWEESKPKDRGLVTTLSPPHLSHTTAPGQQSVMAHWLRKASRDSGTESFPVPWWKRVGDHCIVKSREKYLIGAEGEGGRREVRGMGEGGQQSRRKQKSVETSPSVPRELRCQKCQFALTKTRLPAPSLPWLSHSKIE